MVNYIISRGWTLRLYPDMVTASKGDYILAGVSITHIYAKVMKIKRKI